MIFAFCRASERDDEKVLIEIKTIKDLRELQYKEMVRYRKLNPPNKWSDWVPELIIDFHRMEITVRDYWTE